MSVVVETLESRALFSAAPGIAQSASVLLAAAKSTRTDLQQAAVTLKGDVVSVASDLHGLPKSAQNQALLAKVRKDQRVWQTTLANDATRLLNIGNANAHKIVSDAIAVFVNPTNAAALSRLAADLTTVQNAVSAPLSRLESDAASGRSALATDVNNLASANPTNAALQTDAQQLQTDSQNALDTATNDVQGLQGDLTTLIQNLSNGT
jgi:hypothetical protein